MSERAALPGADLGGFSERYTCGAVKVWIRVAVAIALLWVALEFGRPWVSSLLEDAGLHRRGDSDGSGRCLETVENAVERFGETVLGHLQPPVDLDRWSDALESAEDRAHRARDACRCNEASEAERTSCLAGLGVLDELEGFQRHVDDTLREGRAPVDFARRQQGLLESLERARGRRP
ncbi:MAG TPA: hypothetical protein VNB06_03195 [Thermoanaerobaculia bacterium]|nr:hypothetical protein [Thermoanaerobaculia bacterium]